MLFSRKRSTKRRVQIVGTALLALLVLGGASASAAQAFEWEVGGRSMIGGDVGSAKISGKSELSQYRRDCIGSFCQGELRIRRREWFAGPRRRGFRDDWTIGL